MKKYNKICKSVTCMILGASLLIAPTSCTDRLEGEFYNPDQRTEGELPYFFTKALEQGHLYRMEYGLTYHHITLFTMLMGMGYHGNTTFSSRISNSASNPGSYTNVGNDIFNKTNINYTVNIKGMELLYNAMSEEEKERFEPYMLCARIVRSYAVQRATDLFDDMPYTDAGGGFQENFYAKYDSQEFIYKTILDELKTVADALAAFNARGGFKFAEDRALFASADILNGGNIEKWIRYANSLRLRMALRIVNVEPELSRSIIAELVAGNMLITEQSHDVTFKELTTDVNAIKLNIFFRGFDEMPYRLIGPKYIMEDILHSDAANVQDQDPRLYVLFQPNRYGKYVGNSHIVDDTDYLRRYFPASEFNDERLGGIMDSIAFNYSLSNEGSGWSSLRLVSQYNRATFMNYELSYPVILSSEVNLILAEAAIRWPGDVPGNPVDYVKKSMETSTRYWYEINTTNNYNGSTSPDLQFVVDGAKMRALDEAHLGAYLSKAGNEFESLDRNGKLKYIFNQKLLNFNIINPFETFSEARRLIFDLGEIPVKQAANLYWFERLMYPSTESLNNSANFEPVAHKNTTNFCVWWSGRTQAAINPNSYGGANLVKPE